MSQKSEAETSEIIAELKAIVIEALQIVREKEELLRSDIIRSRSNEQGRA